MLLYNNYIYIFFFGIWKKKESLKKDKDWNKTYNVTVLYLIVNIYVGI